jgi:hypothetical protein
MATFRTLPPAPPPIPTGIHLGKIVKATERISANGNTMLVMSIELPSPGSPRLPCVLTFVEPARRVVDAFCSSAGLIRPIQPDIEVELRPEHVLHRYIYFRVENDEDSTPRITRFLDRAPAITANPALAKVAIVPQEPFALPVVNPPAGR